MKSRSKILLVDDDALLRRVLNRALSRLGYGIEERVDGAAALLALEELDGDAVVVLDYVMPVANGAQVCRAIRSHANPNIAQVPIILLTAFDEERHEIECLAAGADDFVAKPVSIPLLEARIETQLRLASLRNQLREKNRELEEWREVHGRDLEAGRLVQQAVIPQQMPKLAGWSFAAHYQSLIQVGGDIYDWLPLPDGGLLIWIADATGHGVSAALMTTFTKLLFHHAVEELSHPALLMERVNRDFQRIFGGRFFLTAACVMLRPGEAGIRVAGAGHPPILILRRDGRVDLLASTAPPLGLLQFGQLAEKHARLKEGDSLLLFTDGLFSVTNPQGEHLSLGRFIKTLRGNPPASPTTLVEMAMEQAHRFAAGTPFEDDVALVAIRCGE